MLAKHCCPPRLPSRSLPILSWWQPCSAGPGRWCASRRCAQPRVMPSMSARGTRSRAGGRLDMGEHAAGVPGRESPYQRQGALELNPVLTGRLGPGELACVPFDEGLGLRRDGEDVVEAGGRLADLGISQLDE